MKKAAQACACLTLFSSLAYCGLANAQSMPVDLEGWNGTRWGMAIADVQKLLGDSLRLDKTELVRKATGFNLTGETSGRLSNYIIAGVPFEVVLSFDGSPEKLNKVILSYKTPSGAKPEASSEFICGEVSQLLLGKYGKPTEVTSSQYSETKEWILHTTMIQQTRTSLGDLCYVAYKPVHTPDSDKL